MIYSCKSYTNTIHSVFSFNWYFYKSSFSLILSISVPLDLLLLLNLISISTRISTLSLLVISLIIHPDVMLLLPVVPLITRFWMRNLSIRQINPLVDLISIPITVSPLIISPMLDFFSFNLFQEKISSKNYRLLLVRHFVF